MAILVCCIFGPNQATLVSVFLFLFILRTNQIVHSKSDPLEKQASIHSWLITNLGSFVFEIGEARWWSWFVLSTTIPDRLWKTWTIRVPTWRIPDRLWKNWTIRVPTWRFRIPDRLWKTWTIRVPPFCKMKLKIQGHYIGIAQEFMRKDNHKRSKNSVLAKVVDFWAFLSKAALDRYSLKFEFQLPHSNPILLDNMLQKWL